MAKVQLSKKVSTAIKKSPVGLKKEARPSPAPSTATKSKLTGLSIKALLKATPAYTRSNAEDVVVKALKEVTTKGGLPAVRAKTKTMRTNAPVYDTHFIGKEKDIPLSLQKHVLASCSCDDFCFSCEYALNHWGSAVIKYSNGEPALVKNPQNHPLLCKHLCSLAKEIITARL